MTTQETTQLQALLDAITPLRTNYTIEFNQNTIGHQRRAIEDWRLPGDDRVVNWIDFTNWLAASDNSLAVKKGLMDAAIQKYEQLKLTLAQRDASEAAQIAAAFATANPQIHAAMEAQKLATATELEKNRLAEETKKALEEKDQAFSQKQSKTLLYVGITLGVIVFFTVLYFVFRKTKPAPNPA